MKRKTPTALPQMAGTKPATLPTADPADDDMLDALCRYLAGNLPHVADEIRSAMAEQRRVWGGQEVYIRAHSSVSRETLRAKFLEAFNGANHRTLMREFQISRRTAQRWIEAYYRQRRGG